MEIDQKVEEVEEPGFHTDFDQAPEQNPQEQPQEKASDEDVLDTLVPKAEPREWIIGQGEYERKYIQKPLSFIAKMQWFALVGDVLDSAMSGDNALTVGNLLSAPNTRAGTLSMADFRDADTFVQAVGKLVAYAPDFIQKSYCIWLNVPPYDREIVSEIMAQPEDEGGLSDEDGQEIIETFIDQNYEALDRFFREGLAGIQKRVQAQAARQRDRTSPQSKP